MVKPHIVLIALFFLTLPLINANAEPQRSSDDQGLGDLNYSKVPTSWDLSFIYSNGDEAQLEVPRLNASSNYINQTYRPLFTSLNGSTLLNYLEDEKNFSKSQDVLTSYAYAMHSLNVSDPVFEDLLSISQDISAEHYKATSFVELKLKSLSSSEWDELFAEEPALLKYRAFLENAYIRYKDHSPRNESHAAFIADLYNKRMKLESRADFDITNNVTQAGNITLTNGTNYVLDSQSYYTLLSTDTDRENRRLCYDKRFHHLVNESSDMADLYKEKALLDDMLAKELNYTDYYNSTLYSDYLSPEQVDVMNEVFVERKGVFDDYYAYRKEKMNLDTLYPYDLYLQLLSDPGRSYNYTDSLRSIRNSYSKMNQSFVDIFDKTVTSGYVDVYPRPEDGKMPGAYCQAMCALQKPALLFLNYNGLLDDQVTITHEMGHGINFYLMGGAVDYLYCGGTEYEMEIPSTFNEELLLDYVIKNYDRDTAIAFLAQRIYMYDNYFSFQPMITEFEHLAHIAIQENESLTGADLNRLWTNLDRQYRNEGVEYYTEDEAVWTYISHIFLTNNYYTFSYALSYAVTLALFKRYQEDPEGFNESYIAYLSAGSSMTPPEKLEKYFGIRIDRQLFEDALDVVAQRISTLKELDSGMKVNMSYNGTQAS